MRNRRLGKGSRMCLAIILSGCIVFGCMGLLRMIKVRNDIEVAGESTTEVVDAQWAQNEATEQDSLQAMDMGTEQLGTEVATEVSAMQSVTITAAGDCTLGVTQTHGYNGSFHSFYDSYGADYFFQNVRDIFEKDDFTLVNLECVLTESDARVDKTWNLKGRPEYTQILTGSSVEGCSHGNNHCMDYGEESLTDTFDAVKDAGLLYARNEKYEIYEAQNGIKIGVVSANLLSETQENEDYIKNGIEALRDDGADLVIASCHWGVEREHYPTDYQKRVAHNCVDWGADLVVGSHPHVLQGVEWYKGKVICYSLANFCFGGNLNPKDKDTMLYQQTFTFYNGKLSQYLDAKIIPCTVSGHTEYNDFCPKVAEGEKWDSILERVNTYSEEFDGLYFNQDGQLRLKEE